MVFFAQPHRFPPWAHVDQHSIKDSGGLWRFLEIIHKTFPPVLHSTNGNHLSPHLAPPTHWWLSPLPNQLCCAPLFCISVIKFLQEESRVNDGARIVSFTSSSDHSPAQPVVKYLKVLFYMLSLVFWLFVVEKTCPAPIISSWKDQIWDNWRTNTNNNTNRLYPLNKIESMCLLVCE